MNQFSKIAAMLTVAFGFAAANTAQASDESHLLSDATETAEHMKSDPAFDAARHMLRDARAVLIVPALVKGGFIFGAEGGAGTLLARTKHGWSAPAFYNMGSASFGLQIGLEKAEIVLLIMSNRALRAIERSKVTLGADAGITVVTLSAGASGQTAPNLTGDIVAWTSATGAYGGLTLKGSWVGADDDSNSSFYGRDYSVPQILSGSVHNSAADPLRHEVASVW
jgi:lipid-binding SYLF domain-containing protein